MTKPKGLEVKTPTGGKLSVRDSAERKFYDAKKREYLKFKMTHQADKDLLEQLLSLLLDNFRLSNLIAQETEVIKPTERKAYSTALRDNTQEVRRVMDDLGISVSKREETGNKDSWKARIDDVMKKALIFKLQKDKEKEAALLSMARMKALFRMRRRCDDDEKTRLKLHDQQLLIQIEDIIDNYSRIDKSFKEKQKEWNFQNVN